MSQQPIACIRCGKLPQDILLLSCGHDLCLNCAADRLAFQLKRNRNANVIVCDNCQQKTPLDADSVEVLKSMGKTPSKPNHDNNRFAADTAAKPRSNDIPPDRNNNTSRFNYTKTSAVGIDRGIDRSAIQRNTSNNNSRVVGASSTVAPKYNESFANVSSRKNCGVHPDQQILYFCFDCKCECICPECVIHGQHKDHDVKTVRKSQPIVRSQIENHIRSYEGHMDGLQIKKSEFEKQIRNLTEQNNTSKRQIQQAFDDLRAKIGNQERQLLARCDRALNEELVDLERCCEQISNKTSQLKSLSFTLNQSLKKDEITFLNFYAKKLDSISEMLHEPEVATVNSRLPAVDIYLQQILDIGDNVIKIGGHKETDKANKNRGGYNNNYESNGNYGNRNGSYQRQ